MESIETATTRHAGKAVLSLALIDARNRSLRWAAAFEASAPGPNAILRELGRLGWFQEHWITRNLERQRGEQGDPSRPRLASILPEADAWFADPMPAPGGAQGAPDVDLQTIRQYLVDSLETTLELLEGSAETDPALHFYRMALFEEDTAAERIAATAQSLGIDTGLAVLPPNRPTREPLLFAATRPTIGSAPGGFVPENERWAHAVTLPEFEIDAQAITWAQYGEFVEDGGYDERRFWSDAGWAWLQTEGRRTPRYVDQMRQGVLQRRFGRLVRVPGVQPAIHVAWHEADAWCRWAGRRLPGEAEWECAAVQGENRGFRWGEVREWTAGTLRPYPAVGDGADAASSSGGATGPAGRGAAAPTRQASTARGGVAARVIRGTSFASPARLRTPTLRDAAPATTDDLFVGFRSCAA